MSSLDDLNPEISVFPTPLPALTDDGGTRYLTELEARRVWDGVFGDDPQVAMFVRGCRIILAWRLMRVLAVKQGRINFAEPLFADASGARGVTVEDMYEPAVTGPAIRARSLRDLINAPMADGRPGLPMLPPRTTPDLPRFCEVIERIAWDAGLTKSSEHIPYLGQFGLKDLTHPDTVRKAWPELAQIEAFEESLIDQVKGYACRWSAQRARRHLRALLNLASKEAQGILDMALEQLRQETTNDPEAARAHILAHLDDVIDQARAREDLNNVLKAQRLKMAALGLTRGSQTSDSEDDFFDAVSETCAKPLLPGETVKDAEARDITDEKENEKA